MTSLKALTTATIKIIAHAAFAILAVLSPLFYNHIFSVNSAGYTEQSPRHSDLIRRAPAHWSVTDRVTVRYGVGGLLGARPGRILRPS